METKQATGGSFAGWVIPAMIFAGLAVAAMLFWGWGAANDPAEQAVEVAQPDAAEPADSGPTEIATTPEAETPEPAPLAATDAAQSQDPDSASSAQAADPPTIDEVRLEKDGLTVIAGRAQPGSVISVLLDGKETATATADSRGAFAAVALLSPSDAPRVLSLLEVTPDGKIASDDEVILAPVVLPEPQVAALAPAAEPQSDTQPASDAPVATPAPETGQDTTVGADPAAHAETAPDVAQNEAAELAAIEPAVDASQPSDTPPIDADITAAQAETDAAADTAPNAVAVLKSTQSGVELLQPVGPPTAMTNVAIDTISYSDTGDVLLAGRAQEKTAQVRVYLDNAVIATLQVDTDGRWRGDLPQVDSGIYTLRVDEVSETGAVTSRVETPFKREKPGVLIAAAQSQIGTVKAITVQPGNTLWAIARERYGDGMLFVRVFEANNKSIRDPDLIYPGQVFDLPD